MKYNNFKKGYTLLFAVLTAAVVLAVAAFILGISRKQYILASAARESTYAIYAADSGIECAVAMPNLKYNMDDDDKVLKCNDVPNLERRDPGGTGDESLGNRTITWTYDYFMTDNTSSGGSCAKVAFTFKERDPDYDNVGTVTIESRGYNYCVSSNGVVGPDFSNPKTVERALRVVYDHYDWE